MSGPLGTAACGRVRGAALSFRLAVRELRAGVGDFSAFLGCIALGVMAIAGVGSFARSLADGLAREGRVILGGDLAFSIIHREASSAEQAFFAAKGRVSAAATMRAMARTPDGRSALVELKAVDTTYPLYGSLAIEGDLASLLAARDGVFGAVVDPTLLARLDLPLNARISVGTATIELRAPLTGEPDKLASGVGFGPRLLIGEDALRASGLLQPGSLVRWHYRLRLPANNATDRAVDNVAAEARAKFPESGWEVRSRANASPQLERNIERFSQFLTLIGLTALLIGGVGVANAVKSHLERKRETIATLKALGATGGRIFAIYLVQTGLLAALGTAIGLLAGLALPFVISGTVGTIIPLPIAPSVHPGELVVATGYGLFTAVAFAMWPLGRAHDVPVSALYRDGVAPERLWPRPRYVALTVTVILGLLGLAVTFAHERRVALVFAVSAASTFVVLRLIAILMMAIARRLPRARSTAVRLAITNIHRPGALTPTVVLSLGLGLALLVTVTLIDGNLRRQLETALPQRAPSLYFLDIQQGAAARLDALVEQYMPGAKLDRVPMLRGRIVRLNGTPAEDMRAPPQAGWALQGDRGITYATAVPEGSHVVAGEWWGADYDGPPLVSLEKHIADGLSLKVGDRLTVNVLGRNVDATIANLRMVDWQTLGINFVLVYSPGAFRGAPHTSIASLTHANSGPAGEEIALIRAAADALPGVTVLRVKDALDAVGGLIANLVSALRAASLLCILSAILVLGGALAASHRHRVYEAVVLKTLGATRWRLLGAYMLEYLTLGAASAIIGVVAGSLAAWFVVAELMNLRFVWLPGPTIAAAAAALILTVAFGLIGTASALGQKPAPVLRNL